MSDDFLTIDVTLSPLVYAVGVDVPPGGGGGGSDYVLPVASTVTLGGVRIDGTTVVIDGSGIISAVGMGGGGSASIEVSETPPPLSNGALWFDTASAQLFIGYNDGSSIAWIIATNTGTGSGGGGSTYVLPPATTTTLGGVMVDGSTIIVDGDGVISSTTSGGGAVGLVDTTGPGITGGPITTSGTLAVQWNAGPVNVVGTGLTVTAGVMTATAIPYTLPPASTSTLGGVKIDGVTITIDGTGAISAVGTGGGGGVSSVATTGPGITGGPITSTGTLAVQWNAGPASTISTGLLLSGGVLSSTALLSFNTRPGPAITLNSADVTSALSYVPYDGATNPNSYQTSAQVVSAIAAGNPGVFSTLSASGAATFASTVALAADPTLALQAATKSYVDYQVGAVASAGVTAIYYNARTTTQLEVDPTLGKVQWNVPMSPPSIGTATQIYIHGTSSQSVDWSLFWAALQIGQKIVIEDRNDHTQVARWLISGAGVVAHGTGVNQWFTINVTPYGPLMNLSWVNNHSLIVAVVGIGGDQFLPIEGGTLTGPLTVTSAIVGTPYVLAAYVPGVLTASQVLLLHQVSTAITFPANFGAAISGGTSRFGSLANATGAPALTVYKCLAANDPTNPANYTSNIIGTLTFSSGGHAGTLATTSGAVQSVAAGDFIKIVGPASPDLSLANVFITLVGNR